MSRQLTLDVATPRPGVADALVPTAGTSLAVEVLSGRTVSPSRVACLYGPAGSGKSLLLQRWQAGQGANPSLLVVDNLEHQNLEEQKKIFHAFNTLLAEPGQNQSENLRVLTASRAPVAELALLPDLKSRLLLGLQIEVSPPTPEELARLGLKWAAERQLVLPPEVIQYLLSRAERSTTALQQLITQLDTLSLEQRRKITIPLARQALAD